MRATVTKGTFSLKREEPTLPTTCPDGIEVPRLEHRWRKATKPNKGNWDMRCDYVMILPVREYDHRRMHGGPQVVSVLISETSISGGPNDGSPVHADGRIDTPLNDGMCSRTDANVLHLPLYASYEGKYYKVR